VTLLLELSPFSAIFGAYQPWIRPPMAPNIDVVVAKLESLTERLRKEYHVAALHIFGSVARNEARADSDLDVLVDFTVAPSFARFMAAGVSERLENSKRGHRLTRKDD
jgi:predicted nucleotidyltransferase